MGKNLSVVNMIHVIGLEFQSEPTTEMPNRKKSDQSGG